MASTLRPRASFCLYCKFKWYLNSCLSSLKWNWEKNNSISYREWLNLYSCALKDFFLTPWGDNSFSPATCQAGETGVGIKRQLPGKWPLSALKNGWLQLLGFRHRAAGIARCPVFLLCLRESWVDAFHQLFANNFPPRVCFTAPFLRDESPRLIEGPPRAATQPRR